MIIHESAELEKYVLEEAKKDKRIRKKFRDAADEYIHTWREEEFVAGMKMAEEYSDTDCVHLTVLKANPGVLIFRGVPQEVGEIIRSLQPPEKMPTPPKVLVKMVYGRLKKINGYVGAQLRSSFPGSEKIRNLPEVGEDEITVDMLLDYIEEISSGGSYMASDVKNFGLEETLRKEGMTDEIVREAWKKFIVYKIQSS